MNQYLTDLPEERIAKYRLMAANAREAAHNSTTPEAAEIYIAIATAWETMAVEMQHIEDARRQMFEAGRKPSEQSVRAR